MGWGGEGWSGVAWGEGAGRVGVSLLALALGEGQLHLVAGLPHL